MPAAARRAFGVDDRARHQHPRSLPHRRRPIQSPKATHEIAAAVERVLQTDVLVVENEQEVFTAMIAFKEGQGSFADAVIATLGARASCSCTALA